MTTIMDNRFYTNNSSFIHRLASQSHNEANEIYYSRLQTERADQVIFYDIFNQIFAEKIIQQCVDTCMSQADRKNIKRVFELPVESSVKYKGPEPSNSIESQYNRELNTTRIE
jgi:hypothetical protein